jgi:hypothetical protein
MLLQGFTVRALLDFLSRDMPAASAPPVAEDRVVPIDASTFEEGAL